MNLELSFQELAKLQEKILYKQPSFTLEKAREQVEKLKNQNSSIKRMK